MTSRMVVVLLLAGSPAMAGASPGELSWVKAEAARTRAEEVVTGQLNPSRMVPLGFEVGGRLAVSRVSRGQVVKAGQFLGALDGEIIAAQVAQAEAAVLAAEAAAELADDAASRTTALEAEGSVSDAQALQVKGQAKAARAQLAQARAALAQARAGQKRHALAAPFAGTIVEAPDQVGTMVGPGQPVFVLMQLDPLLLKVTVPEAVRSGLTAGARVEVAAVASAAATGDATVKVVLPSADPQTRRVPVEVVVPNRDGRFVANTLARVTLPVGAAEAAFTIPATALGTAGGDHVFTASPDGVLERVPVTVRTRTAATVTVVAGRPVDQVVNYPTPALVPGTSLSRR